MFRRPASVNAPETAQGLLGHPTIRGAGLNPLAASVLNTTPGGPRIRRVMLMKPVVGCLCRPSWVYSCILIYRMSYRGWDHSTYHRAASPYFAIPRPYIPQRRILAKIPLLLAHPVASCRIQSGFVRGR